MSRVADEAVKQVAATNGCSQVEGGGLCRCDGWQGAVAEAISDPGRQLRRWLRTPHAPAAKRSLEALAYSQRRTPGSLMRSEERCAKHTSGLGRGMHTANDFIKVRGVEVVVTYLAALLTTLHAGGEALESLCEMTR